MITILMPIYNGIEFINESVESIKAQTYSDWELIIGINGYPENSEVYKKALTYKSNNIHVLDMVDVRGKAKALNKMLEHAKFDWIALLDVDDIWYVSKLESQIPFMDKYDIIGTHCRYFGTRSDSPKIPLGDISYFDFKLVNPIINSSCLVRKELCYWNNDVNGVEDYDMWLRLRVQMKKFYNVESVQVLHRIHHDSAFNSKDNHILAEKLRSRYFL